MFINAVTSNTFLLFFIQYLCNPRFNEHNHILKQDLLSQIIDSFHG